MFLYAYMYMLMAEQRKKVLSFFLRVEAIVLIFQITADTYTCDMKAQVFDQFWWKYLWIYSFCLVKRVIWIYFLPFKLANTFTLSVSHRIAFCVLADKYRDFLRSSCITGPFNLGLLYVFF